MSSRSLSSEWPQMEVALETSQLEGSIRSKVFPQPCDSLAPAGALCLPWTAKLNCSLFLLFRCHPKKWLHVVMVCCRYQRCFLEDIDFLSSPSSHNILTSMTDTAVSGPVCASGKPAFWVTSAPRGQSFCLLSHGVFMN